MGYTMLKNQGSSPRCDRFSLEGAALAFLRERCENLRFDPEKAEREKVSGPLGTSLREKEIPYNMQMDVDRLCLENAVRRFLQSGQKEDAFDVYFCYLEMFVGDYEKTRRMIELLSEFEANGSGLLMKHRDHYSHSVYVFVLGLAIYQTNEAFRDTYRRAYPHLAGEGEAACHYLQYWGLTALFHDIGYPFELPFEQVSSYFEVAGDNRSERPFVAYHALESFVRMEKGTARQVARLFPNQREAIFETTDELFAYILSEKLSDTYLFTREQMLRFLQEKPTRPDQFNFFMDHAYFSATVLFQKLFCEMKCPLRSEHLDALGAILLHNSLYKFCVAFFHKKELNIPLKAELYPLAYMLMLCDELQCWDRTAYGRNSRKELHPMGCRFDFQGEAIRAVYQFDQKEAPKVEAYQADYAAWQKKKPAGGDREELELWKKKKPKLKAYSSMYETDSQGVSSFLEEIGRIVDLSTVGLSTGIELTEASHGKRRGGLSSSNFIHLYNFAVVLNGRWDSGGWKQAKEENREEAFLSDKVNIQHFTDAFKKLSLEYKLSNINQAKAFADYMDQIGCFYTDRAVDFELVEAFGPEDLKKIGPMEHRRWLQEHYDMGWTYGTPSRAERELTRTHQDMLPGFDPGQGPVSPEQAEVHYLQLDQGEQDKDAEPMACMLAMLRMFDGLRIYRLR